MKLDRNKLLHARARLGYGIEMVGERSEVAKNTVLRAEHEEDIRPSSARKIAQALGVEVADLIKEPEAPKAEAPLPFEVADTPGRGYLPLSHLLEDWRYLIESTAERHIRNASSNLFDTTEGAAAYSVAAYMETAQLFEVYLERLSPTIHNALPESLAEIEGDKLTEAIYRLEEAQEAISKAARAAGVDLDLGQGLSEEEIALIDETIKEYEALPELDRRRQEKEAWEVVDRIAETSIANARELAEEVRNQSSA